MKLRDIFRNKRSMLQEIEALKQRNDGLTKVVDIQFSMMGTIVQEARKMVWLESEYPRTVERLLISSPYSLSKGKENEA